MINFIWSSFALPIIEKSEVDFADEHFLYKKIENKAVYADYSATEVIPEDARS